MSKWILVVDDDPDIRECLVGILEDAGYDVASAENGEKALERLTEREPPCLVILDLMMPIMDGVTFLETVQKMPICEQLEVIVASAAAATEREAVRRFANVRDVLGKPFELSDLLSLVEACAPLSPATA